MARKQIVKKVENKRIDQSMLPVTIMGDWTPLGEVMDAEGNVYPERAKFPVMGTVDLTDKGLGVQEDIEFDIIVKYHQDYDEKAEYEPGQPVTIYGFRPGNDFATKLIIGHPMS